MAKLREFPTMVKEFLKASSMQFRAIRSRVREAENNWRRGEKLIGREGNQKRMGDVLSSSFQRAKQRAKKKVLNAFLSILYCASSSSVVLCSFTLKTTGCGYSVPFSRRITVNPALRPCGHLKNGSRRHYGRSSCEVCNRRHSGCICCAKQLLIACVFLQLRAYVCLVPS